MTKRDKKQFSLLTDKRSKILRPFQSVTVMEPLKAVSRSLNKTAAGVFVVV